MHARIAIRFALFGLGFLSISTQIYLIREFLNIFHGNELVMGIILANWMLLTGFGAYMVRFFRPARISYRMILLLLVMLSALPSVMLISIDLLKIWFFPYGVVVNLWPMICVSGIILLPFCFINGFLFSLLSVKLSKTLLVTAYSIESIGSMVAGALVNFIFLWIFDTWLSMKILTAIALFLVSGYAFLLNNRVQFIAAVIFSAVYLGLISFFDYQGYINSIRYPDQHVLINRGTPYGQVVVTENEHQLNLYENGVLLCSSGNEMDNEESVHFAMVQHPRPDNILQISGGFSGSTAEILKYDPRRVDYIEMNPALNGIASLFSHPLHNSSIYIHNSDARQFIRSTAVKYDVVLIHIPEPSTLQFNRFYTDEFFSELKNKLKPGAVISLSLPTTSDYVSKEAGRLNSSLYCTLKKNFAHVLIIPVDRNYFLGSDSLLRIGIPDLITEKGILTVFVNPYYMDATQMKERSDFVLRNISQEASINRDFQPVTMAGQFFWSIRIFTDKPMPLIILTMVIILIILFSLNPISAGLFSGGFTLASTEVILIFAIQVLYGYVYQVTGLIIMLFMLGLAAGARISTYLFRARPVRNYLWLQIILVFYSLLIPFLLLWFHESPVSGIFLQIFMALLAFFAAVVVGMEYGLASRLSKSSPLAIVAKNYSADLFGAAMGALLVTVFLFPLLGLIRTGLILSILNLLSAACLFFRRCNH